MELTNNPVEHSCAVLTAETRDNWASLRSRLENNENNAEVLRKIDGSVFVLSLEDHKCADDFEAARMFLHGDGKNT